MKAKSILSFAVAMIGLLIATCVSMELAAMVDHTQASDFLRAAPILGMAGTVSFANLNASSESKPNPGGLRLLLIVNKRDVTGVWPKATDIVNGEVATGPTMANTAKLATYSLPDSTFSLTDAQDGDPGFQSYKHSAGFMLAGFDKTLTAELQKHLNTGSLIIGEMNDGTYALVGTSDNPLYVKAAFSSGSKGADKRGYTCKAEADGFMWGVLPISPTVVTALALLA